MAACYLTEFVFYYSHPGCTILFPLLYFICAMHTSIFWVFDSHFSICVEFFPPKMAWLGSLILYSNVTFIVKPVLVIFLKIAHFLFLPTSPSHPMCAILVLPPLPRHYLTAFNIYYLLLFIIICLFHWSRRYIREEFWSFIYWCFLSKRIVPGIQ